MKSLSLILLFASVTGVMAYEKAGVSLPDSVALPDGSRINLYSAGLLRYKVVFKGYVLGFYRYRSVKPAADTAKQFVFHYFWDIDADAFSKAAQVHLEKQLTRSELSVLQSKIDEFHRLYISIREGDRYQLRYVPGTGTQLLHNNRLLGTVKGKNFAKAYFDIWLGDKPLSSSLRKQLNQPVWRR